MDKRRETTNSRDTFGGHDNESGIENQNQEYEKGNHQKAQRGLQQKR